MLSKTTALDHFVPRFLRGRLLCGFFLCYGLGILLACCLTAPDFPGIILFCLAAALGLPFLHFQKDPRPVLLLLGLALGFFLCNRTLTQLAYWEQLPEDTFAMQGVIRGNPELLEEDRYRFLLSVGSINQRSKRWGQIYIYGEGEPPASGSLVSLKAEKMRLQPVGNTNAFNYQEYLHHHGIGGSFRILDESSIQVLRQPSAFSGTAFSAWLNSSLNASLQKLSPEHRALVEGVFLGEKSGLGYTRRNVLGLSGIAHAFAVSGLHIGYLVLIAQFLAGSGYRRRWRRFFFTLCLMLFYTALTGISPSILRAASMSLFSLLAQALNEETDLFTNLSLAAFCSLLYRPLWLLDPGFQLSYASVLGIALYQRHWARCLHALTTSLRDAFSVGMAATTLTLPLTAYYFYHISWLGCLLSPLAVFAAGISVCLAMLAALCSLFFPGLAVFLLQAAAWPMEWLYALAEKLTALARSASVSGAVPALLTAFTLSLLCSWPRLSFHLLKKQSPQQHSKKIILGSVLLLLLFSLLPQVWQGKPVSYTEVVFLDVGQGDATLILTRDGYTALIDGGGSHDSGEVGEYTLLPYLKSRGIQHIDLLVSSHPDQDHIDGLLTVLEQLEVGAVCYSSLAEENVLQSRLIQLAEEKNAELLPILGQKLLLGQESSLLFYPPIAPGEASGNESSLICQLRSGDVSILFPGDAGAETLSTLAEHFDIRSDVLHLPHHGSAGSYEPDFYAAAGSEIAILSVGANNNYGHPADLVVEYWQEHAHLYRTDQQGAIHLFIEDENFWVETALDK